MSAGAIPGGASSAVDTTTPRRLAPPKRTATTAPAPASGTAYVNGRASARAVMRGWTSAKRRPTQRGYGPAGTARAVTSTA